MFVRIDGELMECESCEIVEPEPNLPGRRTVHIIQFKSGMQGSNSEIAQKLLDVHEIEQYQLEPIQCASCPIKLTKQYWVIYDDLAWPVEYGEFGSQQWELRLPGSDVLSALDLAEYRAATKLLKGTIRRDRVSKALQRLSDGVKPTTQPLQPTKRSPYVKGYKKCRR